MQGPCRGHEEPYKGCARAFKVLRKDLKGASVRRLWGNRTFGLDSFFLIFNGSFIWFHHYDLDAILVAKFRADARQLRFENWS